MKKNVDHTNAQRFMMYLAIGCIAMMFAGLTSAYIVKRSQSGWYGVNLPFWFYYSTIVAILSSSFLWAAWRSYLFPSLLNSFFILAFAFGGLFVYFQWQGFEELYQRGYFISGNAIAVSFLYAIVGLHALHVLGGLVAFFLLMLRQAFFSKIKKTALSIFAIYWHFIGALWLYVFFFFLLFK